MDCKFLITYSLLLRYLRLEGTKLVVYNLPYDLIVLHLINQGGEIGRSTKVCNMQVSQETSLPWVEKYRPSSLTDLVAHEEIISVLSKLIESDKLPHLLLCEWFWNFWRDGGIVGGGQEGEGEGTRGIYNRGVVI